MNTQNEKQSMYDKFLNRIHKDKPGDPQIIVGSEMILLSVTLLYKFPHYAFNWSTLFNIFLHLSINIALIAMLIGGLIVLTQGIVIKLRTKK